MSRWQVNSFKIMRSYSHLSKAPFLVLGCVCYELLYGNGLLPATEQIWWLCLWATESGPRRVVCLSTRMGSVRNLEWESFIISLASLSPSKNADSLDTWMPSLAMPFQTTISHLCVSSLGETCASVLVRVQSTTTHSHRNLKLNNIVFTIKMTKTITWWR